MSHDPYPPRPPQDDNPFGLPRPAPGDNPYQAPAARLEDLAYTSDAEAVRRAHIRRETSLRSVGILYWLGAALMLFAGAAIMIGSAQDDAGMAASLGLVYLLLGAGLGIVGWGYRELLPWVRWPGGIFSTLGLLAIPFGTIIHAYILYLMFSPQGSRVFAPDYADIRRQTPHVKFKRTPLEWAIVLVILGGLVALFAWIVATKI
jgi:hypothetical protein